MELPSRPKTDRYTRPGEYNEIERRLQANPAPGRDPGACRLRLRLCAPAWGRTCSPTCSCLTAGPRAIAGAMHEAGFTKHPHRPAPVEPQLPPQRGTLRRRPAGDAPRLQHADPQRQRLRADRRRLPTGRRPAADPGRRRQGHLRAVGLLRPRHRRPRRRRRGRHRRGVRALELLDRLMEYRGRRRAPAQDLPPRCAAPACSTTSPAWSTAQARSSARRAGSIDTGIQRLVQDLDELPHPIDALGLFEPPHSRRTLSRRPIALDKLRRHAGMISLVTTHGCKFHCPYCPIPAYNQFTFRFKSPERMRDEIAGDRRAHRHHHFFGTDDNFFNNRETVEEIFTEHGQGHGPRQAVPRQPSSSAPRRPSSTCSRTRTCCPCAATAGCGPSGSASRT